MKTLLMLQAPGMLAMSVALVLFAVMLVIAKIYRIPLFGMMALAEDHPIVERMGELFYKPLEAAALVYEGALLVYNATGEVKPAITEQNAVVAGVSTENVDNTVDGHSVNFKKGIFLFSNSADADLITVAEVGDQCYIVDDCTVAKTNGGVTRSVAGIIADVTSDGVFVAIGYAYPITAGLLAANNLNDVALAATARANLAFGVHEGIITHRRSAIAGGAAYTVTVADGDATITTATDNAVITLPNIAAGNKGLRVTVMNIGADDAAKVSISPDASDKIAGTVMAVSLSAVANKDAINTKVGANKGDYLTIESDGTDTWFVVGGVGIWASEG
jgi:hypothetical protein